jgi:hypothetical protein
MLQAGVTTVAEFLDRLGVVNSALEESQDSFGSTTALIQSEAVIVSL